jgi:hypothetical protein
MPRGLGRSKVLFRIDLNEVVHVVAHIDRSPSARRDRRGDWTNWTPMCQPNEDWIILKDSASNGPATCLWCLVGERFK